MTLTFGSLFAGIGGLDLGLERSGMHCAWQVEIDDYATKVLETHYPHVARFRDVRACGAHNLARVDCIAGGFPCQDISNSGRKAGITGERSGLWREFARIIGELRPRYVLVENVAALLGRGMGTVLGDLSTLGYDAEWSIVSACALGAPHTRERVFIVAYPGQVSRERRRGSGASEACPEARTSRLRARRTAQAQRLAEAATWWTNEPNMGRVAHGVSARLDRLGAVGNAVVPQVAELIGRMIVDWEREQ